MTFAAVRAAADRLRPQAAVVLGSGLGGATAGFTPAAEVGYADVPGLAPPTVAGHGGRLAVGTWGGVPAVVAFGRVHIYEGHSRERVTALVHRIADLGVRTLLLTNAAGGIRPDLGPGALMAIAGHIKLLDPGAWRDLLPVSREAEPSADAPGRARLRLAANRGAVVYTPRLVALLQQLGASPGVYAALTGPCYETPAEIRALRAMGADAVGMSTAVEAEAAAGLGLEVAGLSCVTNPAAGLSAGPLSHAEVEEAGRLAAGWVGEVIGRFVAAV